MYSDNSPVDLIKEYSPSNWSKKFPDPSDCINHHIQFISDESKRVQSKYIKRQLFYGSSERESYDVYFNDSEETSKIFVYVHGGCWQMLDKESSAYCVAPFVEAGHRVIVVDYNLCPKVSLTKIVAEIQTGIRHIVHYAKDTKTREISVCGHSAGAHLLALLLEDNFEGRDLIKNYFLISGIYDLREIWKNPAMDSNDMLKLDETSVMKLSPILSRSLSSNTDTFIHILYGEHDSPSFKSQSIAYGKFLKSLKFNVKVEDFPNWDHFEIVEELSRKESKIIEYIFSYFN